MKHLARAILQTAVAATLPLAVAAEEVSSTVDESPAAPQADSATAWSQTHLYPDTSLRKQIEDTLAFLGDGQSGLDADVSQLKAEGVLDRRASSKIRNALQNARDTMTKMTAGIDTEHRINGWEARMIAYELGMAGDTLGDEAKPIEAQLKAGVGSEAAADDDAAEVGQQQQLAKTLRAGSSLLKGTARAIVRDLK